MIKAVVFDMDGTLVKTEYLKARSYARAATELRPERFTVDQVIERFKDVVGLSREEVSTTLLEAFDLASVARLRLDEFHADFPWEVLATLRLRHYDKMLVDPALMSEHLCPYNVGLLQYARREGYKTGLATMSYRPQTDTILSVLGIKMEFDSIITREDVERPKPHPEIYQKAARLLAVVPGACLAIEDSAPGFRAALSAGMKCIAVANMFTHRAVHESGLIAPEWIVDDPALLLSVAQRLISQEAHR